MKTKKQKTGTQGYVAIKETTLYTYIRTYVYTHGFFEKNSLLFLCESERTNKRASEREMMHPPPLKSLPDRRHRHLVVLITARRLLSCCRRTHVHRVSALNRSSEWRLCCFCCWCIRSRRVVQCRQSRHEVENNLERWTDGHSDGG